MLHGNHFTCGFGSNPRIDDNNQYTNSGTCPSGYTVVPNHLGYEYLAEPLASHGYIVVSINANRGITAGDGVSGDSGLNLARGRLILKHLQLLSQWNTVGGAPPSLGVGSSGFVGKLDLEQVGLVGHSRGGEGVRAAHEQYLDTGSPWPGRIGSMTVRGIYEIGPVDGQTSRVLDGVGTNWGVLLPMCDGDVWEYMGWDVLGRALISYNDPNTSHKSMYNVWGTNHNFYNTEWQQHENNDAASSCVGNGHTALFGNIGPDNNVMQTGRYSILSFIRGTIGTNADKTLLRNLDPLYTLPIGVSGLTQIDRAFSDSPNSVITAILDDHNNGTGTSSAGVPNEWEGVYAIAHQYVKADSSQSNSNSAWKQQRAVKFRWNTTGQNTYYQSNWGTTGVGFDITDYQSLDFRIGREYFRSENLTAATNFSVHLVRNDGALSAPVQLNDYITVKDGGGNNPFVGTTLHTVMPMARIPLTDFGSFNLNNIRGVRFVFDDATISPSGAIYVSNIRFTKLTATARDQIIPVSTGERYPDIDAQLKETAQLTAITINARTPFPITNVLPKLRVGRETISLSGYGDDPTLKTLVFLADKQQVEALQGGSLIVVEVGSDARTFGRYRGGGSQLEYFEQGRYFPTD